MELDRGAYFISILERWPGRLFQEKGEDAEETADPECSFWDAAEYAADCHLGGALSDV